MRIAPPPVPATRGLLLVAVGVAALGCGGPLVDPVLDTPDFEVSFVNDTDLPIHIMPKGEAFAPSNRIEPGGGQARGIVAPVGSEVPFQAGRNGVVLIEIECLVPDDILERLNGPIVLYTQIFGGGNALVCSNW